MKRQEMADSLCRGGQTEKQWTLWETSGWLKRELFEIFPEMIVLRKWKLVFEHYRESPLVCSKTSTALFFSRCLGVFCIAARPDFTQ